MYVCDCGLELDRNHNAAINLFKKALHTASSAVFHACGDRVRPADGSLAMLVDPGTKQQIVSVIFV